MSTHMHAVGQKMVSDDLSSNCIRNQRPIINTYSPSLWGDTFATFSLDNQVQEMYAQEIEKLKKEVRNMLLGATSSKLIVLVDTLERLGLGYQFEQEIRDKVEEIFEIYTTVISRVGGNTYDLNTTALAFRLLRQHQCQVSADCFDKFVDGKETKKFKQDLVSDIEGLLSLYEAAHVRVHGEHTLDEAVAYTTHHLTALLADTSGIDVLPPSSALKHKIKRALEQSIHRGVPIIETRLYISVYESDESRDDILLKLAKLNFNFMQNLYKEELCQLSRWWNNFDLKTKLPFARDRLIECYLWAVALLFEPKFANARKAVAKSMQMVSIMDDTYDNYGTLNEDQLLTEALERWDPSDIDELPDFMRTVYQFIMSIYEDHARDAAQAGKSFAIPYFRETVLQLGRAYNQEQIWIMERQMPSFEEYINNSVITSCIYVMFTALVPGLTSITKEDMEWLLSEPKLVISTAKMGRHLEDLASHERENRDGKMLTVVDCYMKQHGVSKKEALSKFLELVEDGWKNINTEWTKKSSNIPKDFVEQLLNFARISEVTYKNCEDGYTNPEMFLAPHMAALFIHPIPI